MKKFFSTLVAVIVLVSVPIVAGAEKSADPMSKLGPRLHEKVKAHREKRSLDRVPSMRTEQETVRVILEARQAQEAIDQLKSLGGKIETSYGRFIQVVLPLSSVEEAAGIPQVRSMDLPAIAQEHALTSEGLPLIRVPAWHNRGLRGEGVNVAILDGGFLGYESLLGTELPASPTVQSFRQDGVVNGINDHGTACAEIVYDIAPEANFYLVNFDTVVELGNAVQWLIDQQIDVISFSMGFPSVGPDDGTGVIADMVEHAREHGVLWVSSAGNNAQRHWSGEWRDENSDGLLDFDVREDLLDDSMSIQAASGETIWAILKWDDPWGASTNDYDLYLKDKNGNVVEASEGSQDGTQNPMEEIVYSVLAEGTYNLYVSKKSGAQPVHFRLLVPHHGLERWVEEGSVVTPASSPSAMTVGAFNGGGPVRLQPYSSRGPTVDGRTKPDILAPDTVTTATLNPFQGTSASAPHAAGAAVLVKQLYPTYSPDEIQAFLEGRAIDLGPSGKENIYGSGLASLDPPANWFVDDDLQERPDANFTEIQDAVNAAAPGDSIMIYAGLYQENLKLNKPLSLKGVGVHPFAVNIDRNEADRIVIEIISPNCTVENVSVRNTAGESPYGLVFGMWVRGASFNTIRTTMVIDCFTGIYLMDEDIAVPPWWNGSPIRPNRNLIAGNGIFYNTSHGLHIVGGDENEVRDNLVDSNNGDGVFLSGDRNCLVDNQISASTREGLVIRGEANKVINNHVEANGYGGIILESGSGNVIRSNTFTGNGCSGCSWPTPGLSIESEESNLACRNFFLNKVKDHAWDEYGSSSWDDGGRGNFWDDYSGEDQDGNGIGETAYQIDGEAQEKAEDRFPVTRAELLAMRKADLNGDATTGLADALFAMQIAGGVRPADACTECLSSVIDVDGDDRVSLAEAIFILQTVGGFR